MPDSRAVIDTAPLLAYLAGTIRVLGSRAQRLFRQVETGQARLVVPTVCLFEVAQLEERGRVNLRMPFEQWCDRIETAAGLLLLPLERVHVSEARSLPALRDPFDRLIAGVAVALGLPLITADTRIGSASRVQVLW